MSYKLKSLKAVNVEIKCLEYKLELYKQHLNDMNTYRELFSKSQVEECGIKIKFIELDIATLKEKINNIS